MGKEKASSVGSLGNMQNERSYILSEIKGIPPITAEIVCSELSKGTLFDNHESGNTINLSKRLWLEKRLKIPRVLKK